MEKDNYGHDQMRRPAGETQLDTAELGYFIGDQREVEELEELLGVFELFEAIGRVRREVRHLVILGFLLDSSAAHGLDSAFLSGFLENVPIGSAGPDVPGLSTTEIRSKWRKIDLLILNRQAEFVVVVEDRRGLWNHSRRLRRSRDIIQRKFPDLRRFFLFLTDDGARPADENWITIPYSLIAETLERVMNADPSRLDPDTAALCRHYLKMLRRPFLNILDIARLCRNVPERRLQLSDPDSRAPSDELSRLWDEFDRLLAESQSEGITLSRDPC